MTLRDDITKALKEKDIGDFFFVRLTKYLSILNKIAKTHLKNGCMSLNSVWLWEEFSNPTSVRSEDSLEYTKQYLSDNDSYWFIASEENGKYWLAEGTGKSIIDVINEMYCFEYYIVSKDLKWILCENHHGIVIKTEPELHD